MRWRLSNQWWVWGAPVLALAGVGSLIFVRRGVEAALLIALVGAVVFASVAVVKAVRETRRVARALRGGCPVCGYDLRFTKDRCPECGTPAVLNPVRERYRAALRREANDLVDRCIKLFAQPRSYGVISLAEFAERRTEYDLKFVEAQCGALEEQGFRNIADLEDQTFGEMNSRTYMAFRVLLSADGTIVAAVGWGPVSRGYVYFHSERARAAGQTLFLLTEAVVNYRGEPASQRPPEEDREVCELTPGVLVVLRRHQSRLAAVGSQSEGSAAIRCETLDDVHASVRRCEELNCAYRRSFGYVDIDAVRRRHFPKMGNIVDVLIEEIVRAQLERGLLSKGGVELSPAVSSV